MSGFGRRFDPGELDPGQDRFDDRALTELVETARDLEAFAVSEVSTPSMGFEDRVMAAIAGEAPPRPVARGRSIGAFVAVIGDAWRIATGSGRPVAIRAQALALVLLAAVALGSVGTLAAVGAARLFAPTPPGPGPLPVPTVAPSPSPSLAPPSPSASPAPTPSAPPSASPSPDPTATDPSTADPTPDATDDDGGGGGSGSTHEPDETRTPRPSDTPDPDDTPKPEETCDSSGPGNGCDDDSSGTGSGD